MKKIAIISVLLIVLFLIWYFDILSFFSTENIDKLRSFIESFGIYSIIVFIVGYIIATVLFLPASPLTILAGIIFGPAWGSVWTIIGASCGMMLAFLTARYLLRSSIEDKFKDSAVFKKIDQGIVDNGWRILFITRLLPIFPFNAQNYIYGLTKINFLTYSVLSTFLIMPGTVAYTFLAGSATSSEGLSLQNITYISIGIVLLVILSLIPKFLKAKEEKKQS